MVIGFWAAVFFAGIIGMYVLFRLLSKAVFRSYFEEKTKNRKDDKNNGKV